jgi:hypothetical protein
LMVANWGWLVWGTILLTAAQRRSNFPTVELGDGSIGLHP